MRTTYRGINRAQALKQHREMLEYYELKASGKADILKQKYFPEPTKFQQIKARAKAFFGFKS
jgi:hypothetical protein|tara:strand:- start:67 stop:252 length:186 start_codon:yes stop_codon:yes gene_type:complete